VPRFAAHFVANIPITPRGTFLNADLKFSPANELLTRFATARRRGDGLRRGALLFLRLLAIVDTPFAVRRGFRRVVVVLLVVVVVVRRVVLFLARFFVARFLAFFELPLRRGFNNKISFAYVIL
jgi:hypothetical protein